MNTYQEWEDSLDRNYIEQLDPSAFELAPCAFEAGAQSKQAEIDEYKEVAESMEDAYLREKAKVDELRKRIDEALYCLRKDVELYGMSDDVEIAINFLKGTTNEQ